MLHSGLDSVFLEGMVKQRLGEILAAEIFVISLLVSVAAIALIAECSSGCKRSAIPKAGATSSTLTTRQHQVPVYPQGQITMQAPSKPSAYITTGLQPQTWKQSVSGLVG
ncbi:hypothetical protein AVDCRST_MAG94-3641 [uncultured Leptolyngbya sp.]|uniref:Uncharacterized protein n=1 Tax=uncultured Leptolyngbya sp. TaxID=332963 RepID=A0A6J4MRY4_9CYAN|nr:hypothetical protein AVDCRST_MAG94-3641 [uncultured Leptolyngbya sp.]